MIGLLIQCFACASGEAKIKYTKSSNMKHLLTIIIVTLGLALVTSLVSSQVLAQQGNNDVNDEAPVAGVSFRTIETKYSVPSREKTAYKFSATIHHGANAKQNRVKLTPAQ